MGRPSKLNTWASKSILKLPLIRGFVALVDSLIVGTRALMFSANRSIGEEEAGEELGFWEMALTIIQKLTTREPDDAQLEVALAALKGVLDSGQELT